MENPGEVRRLLRERRTGGSKADSGAAEVAPTKAKPTKKKAKVAFTSPAEVIEGTTHDGIPVEVTIVYPDEVAQAIEPVVVVPKSMGPDFDTGRHVAPTKTKAAKKSAPATAPAKQAAATPRRTAAKVPTDDPPFSGLDVLMEEATTDVAPAAPKRQISRKFVKVALWLTFFVILLWALPSFADLFAHGWIILLPDLPSAFARGIIVPNTDIARWLVFGAFVAGAIWLSVRLLRTEATKHRKVPIRRKSEEPIEKAKDFGSWLAYWAKRSGAFIGVFLLILVGLGIATIPYRLVNPLSNSYSICMENLKEKGQPLAIYTIQGMESCSNQAVILANASKVATTKAHYASVSKSVHDEYCRYSQSGAQAVTDCEAANKVDHSSQAYGQDWMILALVVVLLVGLSLMLWLFRKRPTRSAPDPIPDRDPPPAT